MSRLKEQRSWDNFKKSIERRFHFKRVENQIVEGMSDVIGINEHGTVFWLENKALDSWPVRSTTLPLKGAFEPGQIPFLKEWIGWNGRAFVLLRVDKIYYLLNPKLPLVEQTAQEIMSTALVVGKESTIEYLENLI